VFIPPAFPASFLSDNRTQTIDTPKWIGKTYEAFKNKPFYHEEHEEHEENEEKESVDKVA
jgi:hypothetical protein